MNIVCRKNMKQEIMKKTIDKKIMSGTIGEKLIEARLIRVTDGSGSL